MDAPAKDPSTTLSLQQLRKQRARRLALRFGLFVGLPTLLGAIYFGFVASDRFESVSPFTVQSAESQGGAGLESLIGVIPGASSNRDALSVREYVLSRDVLAKLDRDHGFIAHYQDGQVDWWSRLSSSANSEEAYEYYLDHVSADFDAMSGVLSLKVQAFSPAKAHAFAGAILAYSEDMVNRLSKRARTDAITFAERQLTKAESRLKQARTEVTTLQQAGADINPLQSATAAVTIRGELQGELAKARAELSEARAFMRADAPRVIALNQHVASLAQQVARERKRLVDPGKDEGMHTTLARFEEVLLEKEFAEAAYKSAVASLELARAEAGRQHRYLATIAPPSLPDEATHPRRIYGAVTIFALSIALFGIGALLLAAVREHARL